MAAICLGLNVLKYICCVDDVDAFLDRSHFSPDRFGAKP